MDLRQLGNIYASEAMHKVSGKEVTGALYSVHFSSQNADSDSLSRTTASHFLVLESRGCLETRCRLDETYLNVSVLQR